MEGVITRKQIAGITIEIQETRIGDDIVLILAGGDKPHIGCVVQAVHVLRLQMMEVSV